MQAPETFEWPNKAKLVLRGLYKHHASPALQLCIRSPVHGPLSPLLLEIFTQTGAALEYHTAAAIGCGHHISVCKDIRDVPYAAERNQATSRSSWWPRV